MVHFRKLHTFYTSLIVQSNEEERYRFIECRERLLQIAEIVALNASILTDAISDEIADDLTPQDALVYASIIRHLQQELREQACFLNQNSKDFDLSDIIDELRAFNCRMIPRFDQGYRFVLSTILK
ncbi:hypothetical protein [Roseofilum sp. Guam]|uniref:hypothetical protein n=1 Tax=Roseofilum sp. Guam TaxID=2821502 RepID=UPI001B11940A|nr:hypothetical protein [Roseofilum sp. Guam]MBP0031120.1 hypothetical protein [Roseofilum sp. Guam]